MSNDNVLDILKQAILLETKGKAFYSKVAEQAENSEVKDFFKMMADEEALHISILTEHYKKYEKDQSFSVKDYDEKKSTVDTVVLSPKVKERLSAADFEAAAISAAMLMEERAITLYKSRADEATDPNEKALYSWLSSWEGNHLKVLGNLDREITENAWTDNNFWPY